MRRLASTLLLLLLATSSRAADDVRTLVESGVLAELRWPDVSDYVKHLDAFYRARNDALAWSRNGRVTPQAIAITELFAGADAKGIVDGNIRQKPGPQNAMGNVKFMFPNSMNIYLHDTPGRYVFSRTRRDFSHGCVRVGKPAALAEWVLRDDPKWTLEEVERAMHSGSENRRVNVRRPIPILIVYATAIVPADGKIRFYEDIYGHDATLENALAGGYPYPE
jgi:murein L,D-transpeptidase YcbB/YkuD